MSNTKDEINKTVDALQEFVKEFGANDDYTKLVMEIFLEEIFSKNKESGKSYGQH